MERPQLFISAGEPSGDLLGGELLQALKRRMPELEAFGICGPKMREAGAEALFGIEELSVMGFVEVIKHLPFIKQLESQLLYTLEQRGVRCAVLIDYPGFHLRLAESLRLRGIYVFQYVAPQLWAWGEKRTKTLRAVTDQVLGIMPFEEKFFRERSVRYTYVGTPQVDRAKGARADRQRYGLDTRPTIGFFPGSRPGEISRLLPRMLAARAVLRASDPELRFVVSMAPHLPLELFARIFAEPLVPIASYGDQGDIYKAGDTTLVRGESIHLMKTVDAALVTSGTATLECALVETPMAVVYVMQNLSWQIAKRFVKLSHISLVNLVAEAGLVPEFIQNFSAEEVAKTLEALAKPGPERTAQKLALHALHARLHGDLAERAAEAVLAFFVAESSATDLGRDGPEAP